LERRGATSAGGIYEAGESFVLNAALPGVVQISVYRERWSAALESCGADRRASSSLAMNSSARTR
jgi:hypothetical protein